MTFIASVLLGGQAKFQENFQAEFRNTDYVTAQMIRATQINNPQIAALHTDDNRAVVAYAPIRQATGGLAVRAAAHVGALGDSQAVAVNWVTVAENFGISAKMFNNNVLGAQEQWASSFRNAILNILNRLDAGVVALLLAAKTQVNVGGGLGGTFNAAFDFDVLGAQANFFFDNAGAMMRNNLYTGKLMVVCDSPAYTLAGRQGAQGAGNANNLVFQFNNMQVVPSTRAILAGYQASVLAFEQGYVNLIDWIPPLNRKPLNAVQAETVNGSWGQITIPELGVTFAIHARSVLQDSVIGGITYREDLFTHYEISVDVASAISPLSAFRGANDSVVYTAGLLF